MSHTVPRKVAQKRCGEPKSNEGDLKGQNSPKRSKQSGNEYLPCAVVTFVVNIIYKESKDKKEDTPDKLIRYIVALLNSVGGVIRINEYKNDKTHITSLREKWMRNLEQSLVSMMGQDEYRECVHLFPRPYPDYYVFVRMGKRVFTQNSGMKFPEICSISKPTYKDIVKILNRKGVTKIEPSSESSLEMNEEERMECDQDSDNPEDNSNNFTNQKHTEFHFDDKVLFGESDSIQFKLINNGAATTLSQLLKGIDNHLPKYVSAFANHHGGDVYFGIDDDGTVKGQLVKGEDEKTEVKKMVEKIMNRKNAENESVRIWGESNFIAKYSKQWSVEFVKVIGEPEDEERYVVVVHIYSFNGGMFLKRPLAWKVDETSENIVEMDFDEWKNRHISESDDYRYQEMLAKFDCLTLDGIGKRVYQLKDMTKEFAKQVFPAAEKGLKFVPENFVERFKAERHMVYIQHLQEILQQNYSNTGGFAMFDKSWSGNVGAGLAPEGVICDVFIMSHTGMPQMITLASERSQEIIDYNVNLAKKLKAALVSKGGCLRLFVVEPQIIAINDVHTEMGFLRPNDPHRYPPAYTMTPLSFSKIREALVIVLAGFESSSFNPKIGVSFLYVLTPEQYKISIKKDPFVVVSAPPGTGKTVVAMERIRKLQNRGVSRFKILYICENKALESFIQSKLGDACLSITRAKLMWNINQNQCSEFDEVRHVVVDEAQKFSNEEGDNWFKSILSILNWPTTSQQHYKTTSLYVFCDQLQKIRHEYCGLSILDSNKDPREMLPDIPTKCQLSIVIRNSTKIYEEWEKIARGQSDFKLQENNLAIGHDYQGRDVNFVEISSDHKNEIFSKVKEIILEILHEKSYEASDVAVLFNNKDEAEVFREHFVAYFAELKIPVTDAELFPRKGVVVDSLRRFSGLEAPVVIAVLPKPNPFYENEDKVNILLYSRAMVELHIILLT